MNEDNEKSLIQEKMGKDHSNCDFEDLILCKR